MPLLELADRLSVSAAGVEGILHRGVPNEDGNLGLFRVGRLSRRESTNADRLQLCQVDVGEGEARQIVCGVELRSGSDRRRRTTRCVLPDGRKLEPTKLRGELSNG